MISRTGPAITALAVVVIACASGCAADEAPAGQASPSSASSPDDQPSSSPPASSTTQAAAAPFTITALAAQPCRASEVLESFSEPVEPPKENNEPWLEAKSCHWSSMRLNTMVFTPFPAADRTTDRALSGNQRRDIGGHPGLVAPGQKAGVCHVYVSLGGGQSMRVIRGPMVPADTATSAACEEAVDVAGQIAARITPA